MGLAESECPGGGNGVRALFLHQMENDCSRDECLNQGGGTPVPRKLDVLLTCLDALSQSGALEAKQ